MSWRISAVNRGTSVKNLTHPNNEDLSFVLCNLVQSIYHEKDFPFCSRMVVAAWHGIMRNA